MTKQILKRTTLAAALVVSPFTAVMASASQCIPIGGIGTANLYPEGESKPIVIAANMIGSVSNAAGKVTAQRKTATGLEMDMVHYFGTEKSGSMHTKDLAILTAVPGKPGTFMVEITYKIQPGETRGTFNWGDNQYTHGTGYGHLVLKVDDLFSACERLGSKGVKIIREPGLMTWPVDETGHRENIAFIEDPNGYQIELVEAPTQGGDPS